MQHDYSTWDMARRIVTLHGAKSMHGACDVAQHPSLYRDVDPRDRIAEVVDATNALHDPLLMSSPKGAEGTTEPLPNR
jgi:hypothetical protein